MSRQRSPIPPFQCCFHLRLRPRICLWRWLQRHPRGSVHVVPRSSCRAGAPGLEGGSSVGSLCSSIPGLIRGFQASTSSSWSWSCSSGPTSVMLSAPGCLADVGSSDAGSPSQVLQCFPQRAICYYDGLGRDRCRDSRLTESQVVPGLQSFFSVFAGFPPSISHTHYVRPCSDTVTSLFR